jgi:hypothetical protein
MCFDCSWLTAAAAFCCGWFHVKWDAVDIMYAHGLLTETIPRTELIVFHNTVDGTDGSCIKFIRKYLLIRCD